MAGNVAGIDKLKTRLVSNIISVLNGGYRGGGQVPQSAVGIETGDMPGRKLTKLIMNPVGDALKLLIGYVKSIYDNLQNGVAHETKSAR